MAEILVVDDEDLYCRLLTRVLHTAGFEVNYVTSGNAALKYLNTKTINLLVTDIYMPGMDGLELIGLVRDAWPDVSIIAISAGDSSGVDFLDMATRVGADRTCLKHNLVGITRLVRHLMKV